MWAYCWAKDIAIGESTLIAVVNTNDNKYVLYNFYVHIFYYYYYFLKKIIIYILYLFFFTIFDGLFINICVTKDNFSLTMLT